LRANWCGEGFANSLGRRGFNSEVGIGGGGGVYLCTNLHGVILS